jgi:hypothetical protein
VLRPDDRRLLRHHTCFDSPDDARPFVAWLARRSRPGTAIAVMLDRQRRLLDVRAVPRAADRPDHVLGLVATTCHRRAVEVLLLIDRTGQPLGDRPDDELVWEELVEHADELGLHLVDWWVLFGDEAFSVAERCPTPAGW